MREVRLAAKLEGMDTALNYFQRFPYPEAVRRVTEKVEEYRTQWNAAHQERSA